MSKPEVALTLDPFRISPHGMTPAFRLVFQACATLKIAESLFKQWQGLRCGASLIFGFSDQGATGIYICPHLRLTSNLIERADRFNQRLPDDLATDHDRVIEITICQFHAGFRPEVFLNSEARQATARSGEQTLEHASRRCSLVPRFSLHHLPASIRQAPGHFQWPEQADT